MRPSAFGAVVLALAAARAAPAYGDAGFRGDASFVVVSGANAPRFDLRGSSSFASLGLVLERRAGTGGFQGRGAFEVSHGSWSLVAGGVSLATLGGWRTADERAADAPRASGARALSPSTARDRPAALGLSARMGGAEVSTFLTEEREVALRLGTRGMGRVWEVWLGDGHGTLRPAVVTVGWLGRGGSFVGSARRSRAGVLPRVILFKKAEALDLRAAWQPRASRRADPLWGQSGAGWSVALGSRRWEIRRFVDETLGEPRRRLELELMGTTPRVRWRGELVRRGLPATESVGISIEPRGEGAWKWTAAARVESESGRPMGLLLAGKVTRAWRRLRVTVDAKSAFVRGFWTVVSIGRQARAVRLAPDEDLVSVAARTDHWEVKIVRRAGAQSAGAWLALRLLWGGAHP